MNEQLNYKDCDGRIYAYKKGNNYFSKTISPYHPKFLEQIEEGIKDIVFSFLNKNYIVLGSCEGHSNSFNSSSGAPGPLPLEPTCSKPCISAGAKLVWCMAPPPLLP